MGYGGAWERMGREIRPWIVKIRYQVVMFLPDIVAFVDFQLFSMCHIQPVTEQTAARKSHAFIHIRIIEKADQDSKAATNDSIAFTFIVPVPQFHIDTPL
jgi:hypothetical protein